MTLIKEMLKKTCYGFAFGSGIGLSISITPKNYNEMWPEQAFAKFYQNKKTQKDDS
jgi:hypothetical protein